LEIHDLREAIAAFWDEYDRDESLRAEVNEAVEPIASLDPTVRRNFVQAEAPPGFEPQFVDIILDAILGKVAAELVWRMIQAWLFERHGLDALGDRPEERDQNS